MFVLGLGNRVFTEILRNLAAPDRYPVRMVFGPEVDLTDLRKTRRGAEGSAGAAAREAADRCRAALQLLADAVRAEADPSYATIPASSMTTRVR